MRIVPMVGTMSSVCLHEEATAKFIFWGLPASDKPRWPSQRSASDRRRVRDLARQAESQPNSATIVVMRGLYAIKPFKYFFARFGRDDARRIGNGDHNMLLWLNGR